MAGSPAASAALRRSGAVLQIRSQSYASQSAGHSGGVMTLALWWQQPLRLLIQYASAHHHCRRQPDGADTSDSDSSIGAGNSAAEEEEGTASRSPRTQVNRLLDPVPEPACRRAVRFSVKDLSATELPHNSRMQHGSTTHCVAFCHAGHLCQPHALAAEPVCGRAPPHAPCTQHRLRGPGFS